MGAKALDVLLERELVDVDVPAPPELALEREGLRLYRPRAIAQRLVAPEPIQDHAEVPVLHRVAEKEEMAATELGREAHRDNARDIRLREVVDVIVLGDDEALPLALRAPVDLAVQLQDHGPALERKVDVGVREVDQPWLGVRRQVAELSAVAPAGEIGDDVELLPRVREGALERNVVARGDDELVRRAAF